MLMHLKQDYLSSKESSIRGFVTLDTLKVGDVVFSTKQAVEQILRNPFLILWHIYKNPKRAHSRIDHREIRAIL